MRLREERTWKLRGLLGMARELPTFADPGMDEDHWYSPSTGCNPQNWSVKQPGEHCQEVRPAEYFDEVRRYWSLARHEEGTCW